MTETGHAPPPSQGPSAPEARRGRRLAALVLVTLAGAGSAWWLLAGRLENERPPGARLARNQRGIAPSRAPPRIIRAGPKRPGPKSAETSVPLPQGWEPAPGQAGPGPHIARYGGRSGALPAGARPQPAEPLTEITSTEKDPELVVWVPSIRVEAEGTTIFARLSSRERVVNPRVEVAVGPAEAKALPAFRAMTPAVPESAAGFRFPFRAPKNPVSGAGVFTRPPQAFRYLVRARGEVAGRAFARTAGGLFFVHQPGGQIVPGSIEVAPAGGDLKLSLDVSIERPGTYWAYAELWGGPTGETPIAFARERLERVGAGRRSVGLVFGGAILRDREVPGPYVVRNLRFQQVDTHPPHEAAPIAELPPTPAFSVRTFR